MAIVSDALSSEGVGLEVKSPEKSESDKEKAKLVWKLLADAKSYRSECGWTDGAENWRYWEGKQWERQRPRGYHMPVINQVYKATETFNGHIMDSIPDAVVHPRRPQYKNIAEKLEKLINWVDDINDFNTEIEMPVRAAQCTGVGVWRVDWDPTADNGRGAPSYYYVDEDHVFFGPYSNNIENCPYVLEARQVPISVIRNWEGGKGELVKPGLWDGSLTRIGEPKSTFHQDQPRSRWGVVTTTDGLNTQSTPQMGSSNKPKDMATLVEAWIRQDDGTLRYIVVANGIVLQDTASPYDDEEFPYVVMNVIRGKNIFGHSLVKFYKNLQRQLNESNAYMLDQARYESDSPLVVNAANITSGRPTNQPGSVYVDQTEGGRGYYRLVGPGPDMKNMSIQEMTINAIEDIAGSVDILRGDRPAGVSTLGGMEIVREAANVLVSKMLKHILAGIKRKNMLVINRIRQFMKDERIVRITGSGGASEYVQVNKRVGFNPDGSPVVEEKIPADFESDVDFTAVPPGGRRIRAEDALQLYQVQAVDQKYLLEEFGIDEERINNVMQRMAEAQQAAEKAEMQRQAAAHGTGGMPGMQPEIPPDQAVRIAAAALQ